MTGYDILPTFGSHVRACRMSSARADVSSHPRSLRFKYQTRAQEAQRYNARVMCKPRLTHRVNGDHRFSQFPFPFTFKADYHGFNSSWYSLKFRCVSIREYKQEIQLVYNISIMFENLWTTFKRCIPLMCLKNDKTSHIFISLARKRNFLFEYNNINVINLEIDIFNILSLSLSLT